MDFSGITTNSENETPDIDSCDYYSNIDGLENIHTYEDLLGRPPKLPYFDEETKDKFADALYRIPKVQRITDALGKDPDSQSTQEAYDIFSTIPAVQRIMYAKETLFDSTSQSTMDGVGTTIQLPSCFKDCIVEACPATVYYIPNFITAAEEQHLIHKIKSAPIPKWRHLNNRRLQVYPSELTAKNKLVQEPLEDWLTKPIIKPRLLDIPMFGTTPNTTPVEMALLGNIFSTSTHHEPNQVLINEYLPGQGIHAHRDGSAYSPIVATISLGSAIVLDIQAHVVPDDPSLTTTSSSTEHQRDDQTPHWRILQEPRSLLVSKGPVYEDYTHGIAAVMMDEDLNREGIANWDMLGDQQAYESGSYRRRTRYSMTYRDVERVVMGLYTSRRNRTGSQ
ncbi:hypothetical protein MMC09_001875 [Bachmanniomyces sp. S44760]|nr:hypothetical protein [Bachmanniomyces sp. S44760]